MILLFNFIIWACPSQATAVFSLVIANAVKQSQKNSHCPTRDCFGLRPRNDEWLLPARVGLLRASLSLRQSFRYAQGSAGGSLRSPPPSASLTQFLTHPLPLSFEKERGDAKINSFNCSPSLILLERGN